MKEPQRRFHLSTLLVVTLIAGGWMVLNTVNYKTKLSAVESVPACCGEEGTVPGERISREVSVRGFPFPTQEGRIVHPGWHGPAELVAVFDASSLAWNIVCGLFAMGLVGTAMEVLIYPREKETA